MIAGSICTRDVDVAYSHESAWVAAERMHQRAVGALVVVTDNHEPIGIITDRDLVERVMAKGLDPNETLVTEIMTVPVKTIGEETPIDALLPFMNKGGFRRVPVVDDRDRLVGIVTLDDVLMLWAKQFAHVQHLLERETPRSVAESLPIGLG